MPTAPRPLAAVALAAALAAPLAAAQDTGKADGTLQLGGKTIRLKHAFAWQNGNEEGLDDKPSLMVFLSDVPLPAAQAVGATTGRATLWARANGATVVVVRADPAGKAAGASASVLAAPGLEANAFTALSSSEGLTGFRVAGGRVAATANIGTGSAVLKASFDAPLAAASVTQDVKGEAAAQSAQAKAFLAYMAALKKGDFGEAARYATASRMRQLEQVKAQAGPQFAAMMKQMPAASAKSIARVVVRGDQASIVQTSKEVNELVREGGDWKVD